MNNDSVTWEILGKGKCSFKKKVDTEIFCLNEYNVTGLCTKSNCPLSNSVYSTIILDKGEIYLYMKSVERAHLPSALWSRVLLSLNKKEAFNVIYKELKFTQNIKHIKKCMKRYIRIKEILKRSRKLILQKQVKIMPIKKKTERRDKTREKKALKAANLLNNVEKELLNRLNTGIYGSLYKFLTPKKKMKNKDSELTKIFDVMEENKDELKKKGKKGKDENVNYETMSQEGEETDVDVDMDDEEDVDDDDEEDVDDDDEEDVDDDDDEDVDEDDDDEDIDVDMDDEDVDDDDEGGIYDDDDEDEDEDEGEDDYDNDNDDDKDSVEESASISHDKKNKKKRKRKEYKKEYVDNEHIKNLQANGKLSIQDDEIEEMNHNFRRKKKSNNKKEKGKKKIKMVYEND
ncbi:nucleolar preribosomal assembly protein, putative [Plasmodium sp. gorilla clade G2]|uniref:nucleolar preribosomal assembly protein, putative n=1 Tax=Plasmodium sp. gorilla clade G2 TaxID=880535 RepID=UPI000D20543B|nr:nucleolar preribosomal assembly protein, putative [Plasmodium sp. gorilla clade G2]SOV10486.1 nucleolar preribosomal assembly protein, putative [Plasmodium sp. gorilla clade G2]